MSYILTLVASDQNHPLQKSHIKLVEKTLDFYNLSSIEQPLWLAPKKAVDIAIDKKAQSALMSHLHSEFENDKIDVFCTPKENRQKKLLLADMDSTIVSSETLDDLAAFAGYGEQVAAVTQRAMEGLIDFKEAVHERVAVLKGLGIDKMQECLEEIQINPGAKDLVFKMKASGARCILVSGGFTFFTSAIAEKVGFDLNHGNTLEIQNDILTGKVIEPIQDKYAKLEYLRQYCKDLGITENDVITVGDGANDIPMLKTAGLGVGYHPKEAVKREIDNIIVHGDLSALLYIQGYTEKDIQKHD